MFRLRLFSAALAVATLATMHAAIGQNAYPSPTAPSGGSAMVPSNPTGSVPGVPESGSSSETGYPTAVQCAQAQGQAQTRPGVELTPYQQRMLQQCARMNNPSGTVPGTTETPAERIPR